MIRNLFELSRNFSVFLSDRFYQNKNEGAFKKIDDVIDAVDSIGISRKVAKLLPVGNIKG
jgi:RNA-splicing ligase RtcB